jgi:hypothetical protein
MPEITAGVLPPAKRRTVSQLVRNSGSGDSNHIRAFAAVKHVKRFIQESLIPREVDHV